MDVLIVDGYNIIGAWPELRELKKSDFENARERLIKKMAEYKAFTGYRVIIVFDAHLMPGIETKVSDHNVEVIFTKENETADERIEKMASELNNIKTQVHVATSDFTEQWVVFGQGALRKSARELLNEMNSIENKIDHSVKKTNQAKVPNRIEIKKEIVEIFEKWRRGEP